MRVPVLDPALHTTEDFTLKNPLFLFKDDTCSGFPLIFSLIQFTSSSLSHQPITLITQSSGVQNTFSLGFAIRFWAFALFSFRPRSMRHASDVTAGLTAFACSFDSSSIPRRCACKEHRHGTRFPTLGDIVNISGITRYHRDRLFLVGTRESPNVDDF